jgi:hypothetical protein
MTKKKKIWNNAPLILYHSTLAIHAKSIEEKVDLSKVDPISDFGKGFYTTTSKQQAKVYSKLLIRKNDDKKVETAIVEFTVDRNLIASLESLSFVRMAKDANDFWNLVEACRKRGQSHKENQAWYDLVIGPVASAFQKRIAWSDYDQVSFHTERAVEILNQSKKRILKSGDF